MAIKELTEIWGLRKRTSEIHVITKTVGQLEVELVYTESCNTGTGALVKVVKQAKNVFLHTVISELQEFTAVAVEAGRISYLKQGLETFMDNRSISRQ